MLLTLLLQEHYLGEDDHTNQWPLLVTLVGIYFWWKWIKSVKNNSNSKRVNEASSKEANIKSEEVKQLENKESIEHKTELKGSLANLSLKKASDDSEASKDALDEDSKAQAKLALKGAFAGVFKKSEHSSSSNHTKEEPKLPASEDDESVV